VVVGVGQVVAAVGSVAAWVGMEVVARGSVLASAEL
jgi:hypothetical protein